MKDIDSNQIENHILIKKHNEEMINKDKMNYNHKVDLKKLSKLRSSLDECEHLVLQESD